MSKMLRKLENTVARFSESLNQPLSEGIFFLHLPKCGGSSIAAALRSCYRSQRDSMASLNSFGSSNAAELLNMPVLQFREQILLYYMGQEKIRYVAGHFPFSQTAFELFHDRFAFITVLRDPVPRWISEYFFNRYKKSPHNRHDMPIEEFLESDKGRDQGCQYVRFLANPNAQDDLRSASVIDQAKQNLLKVDLVGFVEHQHDFVRQFHERFGRKLNIGHLNKNPKAKQDQQALLTDDIMERITAVCRPDIEIFQFAVENFSSK